MISNRAKEKLKQANVISHQVNELLDQMNLLLEQYAKEVIVEINNNPDMTITELNTLLFVMPSGFERAECRTYYSQFQQNLKGE